MPAAAFNIRGQFNLTAVRPQWGILRCCGHMILQRVINHQSEPIAQYLGTRRLAYAVVTSFASRYRGRKME